ncbi:MAG: amidohydrolase family protein [Phycisphaerales bacterium]|nr:amidohydrolase family protein [Phycisphaerales bacterium]
MMNSGLFTARWIMPAAGPPMRDACLAVEGGRIVSVQSVRGRVSGATDFGEAIILPGLINAHTHLELTGLAGRVPYRGSFIGWLESLIRAVIDEQDYARFISAGLSQSLATGVTVVGDIGIGQPAIQAWRQGGIHTIGFLEVLGMGHRSTAPRDRSTKTAEALLVGTPPTDDTRRILRVGISPHAPYTTDPAIYRRAVDLANRLQRPLCTHLAETRAELQFLSDGTGPFRDFLERYGLWDDTFKPPGDSPIEYANRLGLLKNRCLLVHANYVSNNDLDLLARTSCSIVYCPRSHHFFHHEPHRFGEMIRLGINVCLGTDSLASNDSLSILDELRFVHATNPAVDPARLLHMATRAGAVALGLETQLGQLTPGLRADFVALPLEQPKTTDPFGDLLHCNLSPIAVFLSGKQIYGMYKS